ncbi:MAG TPA: hypothetical protein VFH50_13135 [Acidimicrobiales bacterium]|nr:hypothetical protein [Acidimicrobiales bacterium]
MTDTDVLGEQRSGAEGAEGAATGEPGPGRTGILLGLVSGVALAGLGGSVAFGVMWAHDRSAASDQADAHNLASEFLLDLTNFGPKTIEADFSQMQAMATGNFATQARQTLAPNLRRELIAAQVQTQGHIKHLWIQSYSGSAASFYAEVDQTFRNNKSPAVRSDTLRAEVDLTKVDGKWKVAQVTTIGSGTAPGATPGG